MGTQRAVIVGGGLAGMTVANELAKRGWPVTILESEFRLGGKAGSQKRHRFWEDHGYHIFPAWYENTRRLLDEIGCLPNLIDLHQFHFLKRGAFPNFVSMKEWSTIPNLLHNFQAGMLPFAETVLSYYFLLDLAAEPFSNRAFLDRVSASGFLRSRFYATEGIAEVHHQSALQGSAIPYYEVSAMTIQKLVRAWFRAPSPLVSILNGPLQERFIEPFSKRLSDLNVKIQKSARVTHLQSRDGAIRAARLESGEEVEGDVFVLATPCLEALQLVDGRIYEEEQKKLLLDPDRFGLVDLAKLHSAPMAAFHVHFDRHIAGLPQEHVMLQESRFGMSFIDVSSHWGLDHTSLSLIASNFSPLGMLTADWDYEPVKRSIVQELHEYIPEISVEDLDSERIWLQPHVKHPLFLNTVGAWHFRPESRDGTGVPNLFVTGDYCRSDADLTTMESAVWSALQAAAGILERAGIHDVTEPLPIKQYPRGLLTAMKYAGLPLIYPLSWWVKFREQHDKSSTDG